MIVNPNTCKPLTVEERREIGLLTRKIENLFDWSSTEEGHDYWARVCDHLERYANSTLPQRPKS